MVKSMTGFGRYELTDGHKKITVEMKSVNHRYLELTIKMPKKLNMFEANIRNVLKEYISRGKVDVFITYEDTESSDASVRYNKEIASEYVESIRKISADFNLNGEINAAFLAKMPDVLTTEDETLNEDEVWANLETAVRECAARFVDTRIKEGEKLKADLLSKLSLISDLTGKIEKRSPEIVAEYRSRLMQKVNEVLSDQTVSEAVLATEIVAFADKICVDEEMVRLKAHITNMAETLKAGKDVGRKLDFVAQEMNREANTTLSKSNDVEISNIGIDLKTEIEKIREQIQNIE